MNYTLSFNDVGILGEKSLLMEQSAEEVVRLVENSDSRNDEKQLMVDEVSADDLSDGRSSHNIESVVIEDGLGATSTENNEYTIIMHKQLTTL